MVQLQESFVNQGFYLGKESTYATAVAANKRLLTISAPFAPMIETEAFTPSGDTAPSIVVINDEFTAVDATGKPDFNAMPYFMASLWGDETPTNPGAGLLYHWAFQYDGRTPLAPVSYTAIYGSVNRARQAAGLIWTQYGMSVSRTGIEFTAAALAKEMEQGIVAYPRNEKQTVEITYDTVPSGGDFTLTYSAQTTAAIAYDAAAAAVQSALEALSNIAPGEVTVTGGPGPSTPWVVEFSGGTLDLTDVVLMTANAAGLTGGTNVAVVVTETQKGGTSTDIAAKALFPGYFDVYLDDTWANLGDTKLLYCYDFSLETAERIARTRPINSTKSSDGFVETEDQTTTVTMTLGIDATQEAIVDSIRAGEKMFVRLDAIGADIDANGPYMVRHDMCILGTEVGAFESSDNVHVLQVTGRLARDETSGLALEATVDNTISAL